MVIDKYILGKQFIETIQDCDWRGVDVILTYHGDDTIKHRLAILSNFPETFHPYEYRSLLLETGSEDGEWEVMPWTQKVLETARLE
ncbi:hypothetical protein NP493_1055g01017 [Ridgeia piscesae]|uniref:Uncharacterized protein n=1 Tax=Ridgeia piscesae TaxID=27915 RepID=A0AAD9NIG4_RIDPI|nr:hypothetical protein NP493_1055g01017 [Ridgeia piscesae]